MNQPDPFEDLIDPVRSHDLSDRNSSEAAACVS